MTDNIERTLGSIEGKIDGLVQRMDRQTAHLFGQGGMEERLRRVENEQSVIRGKAGAISAAISAVIALIVSFFHLGK